MSYLNDWQLAPPSTTLALFAVLYVVGWRRRASRRRGARTQAALFGLGVVALVVALNSPLATLDETLFWAHMTQHVLLLVVAPPLLLLGRPWSTVWRAFPFSVRRRSARGVLALGGRPRVRVLWHVATAPATALAVFVGTLAVWHLPAVYDATLRSSGVHVFEHVTFLASGLLFWSQLVDSPPVRSRLGYPARALHATIAMAAGWLLALVIVTASTPLYEGYAELASRPGGISALADEQLAAGIMWVPGSIPFLVAVLLYAYRWLEQEESS